MKYNIKGVPIKKASHINSPWLNPIKITVRDIIPHKTNEPLANFPAVGNSFQIFKYLFIYSTLFEPETFH